MSEVNKGGRPKGSKSIDSLEYAAFLVKKKFCCPAEELEILKECDEQYQFYKGKVHEGRFSPMEDQASRYLKIKQDLLREMAGRLYPKLKSIEHIKTNPLEGKSPEEQLAVLDHLRVILLEEIKSGSSTS